MTDKEILIQKTMPSADVLHEMFYYDGEKLWWLACHVVTSLLFKVLW